MPGESVEILWGNTMRARLPPWARGYDLRESPDSGGVPFCLVLISFAPMKRSPAGYTNRTLAPMIELISRLSTAIADRYTIEREIGAGGMATVYLAEDLKHRRKVAIKVLRPDLTAAVGPDRFLREIEIAANLTHPHILPLYDSGEADSFLYYVMPFVDGESLRDKLNREKQLGVEETVKIAESVAAALQYAHERDVVHLYI